MYFNNSNNYFHGIMFHHFHDGQNHKRSQGSISKDDFVKLIKFINRDNILDADIFFEKCKSNTLKANELCFTFDDGIKSQIDVALPILEDFKIKSFFFVPTSMFTGKPDNLEIFRHFRTNYFKSINEFYKSFFKTLDYDLSDFLNKQKEKIKEKKNRLPLYSYDDIKFRLVRDIFLGKEKYENIMLEMIKKKNINLKDFYPLLLFNKQDLKNLDSLGHMIGLHSHFHPTSMAKLSYKEQENEYSTNLNTLSEILEKPKNQIKHMSHPCGDYNNDTLKILKNLGIELGFKQHMFTDDKVSKVNNSSLEIAREDHAKIMQRINK